ncbi:MAG: membrane protein insertion efficiency factor YidD [Lentisphaeria bacterium]
MFGLRLIVKKIFILPIIFYQRVISPCKPRVCRFHPSCSQFAKEAIMCHGVIKGIYLATLRLLKCQPFYHGNFYDPVIDKNGHIFNSSDECKKK